MTFLKEIALREVDDVRDILKKYKHDMSLYSSKSNLTRMIALL
jgi:hypothetical protein